MDHGRYTSEMGRNLSSILGLKGNAGIKVFYDHGDKKEQNCCKPTLYFEKYSTASTLAHVDLAIVDETGRNAKVLCEIEEEGGSPKKILGDICSILLADKLRIKRKDYTIKQAHYILGVKVREDGKSSEKTAKLENKIREVLPLNGITFSIICGTNYENLIDCVKKEIGKTVPALIS